ncbi:MAG TPA: DUF1893 domain-containing protein [Bacilli bacterium]|nr:DUF1893 domain-containing protein [Bacilli bacterium]
MKSNLIELIQANKHSIVIEQKGNVIYQSNGFGLWPLYHYYKKNNPYYPIDIYDKVTGTGAARLILAMENVHFVYSNVITKEAYELLSRRNIELKYEKMVDHILNKQKDDLCPVEKISKNYVEFTDFMNELDLFYVRVKEVYEKNFLNE